MKYHNSIAAIVYYEIGAECRALYQQTFALAKARLLARIEAYKKSGVHPENFYIISDLDETLLDNSPFRSYLIQTGREFHQETWSAWCQSKGAVGTPGAKEFLDFVVSLNVKAFYVTSRLEADRAATAQNLVETDAKLGLNFPLPDGSAEPNSTHLFMSGMLLEAGGAPSKKKEQYAYITKKMGDVPPLLQLGDNLSDLSPDGYGDRVRFDQRIRNVDIDSGRWGDDWIVFPNPVYGGWANSLRIVRNGVDTIVADEIPPAPYVSNPVREPVTTDDSLKVALLPTWQP